MKKRLYPIVILILSLFVTACGVKAETAISSSEGIVPTAQADQTASQAASSAEDDNAKAVIEPVVPIEVKGRVERICFPNGALAIQRVYDENDKCISETEYTAQRDYVESSLYGWQTPNAIKWHWQYSYDENGNMTKAAAIFSDDPTRNTVYIYKGYDNNGNWSEMEYYNSQNTLKQISKAVWQNNICTISEYNADGSLVCKTVKEYDLDGKRLIRSVMERNGNKTTVEYGDKFQNVIHDRNGRTEGITQYTYNDEKQIIKEESYEVTGNSRVLNYVVEYDTLPDIPYYEAERVTNYSYSKGRVNKTTIHSWYGPMLDEAGWRWEYDVNYRPIRKYRLGSNNQIVDEERFNADGMLKHRTEVRSGVTSESFYADKGKVIKEIIYGEDQSVIGIQNTDYDDAGNITAQTECSYYSDGTVSSSCKKIFNNGRQQKEVFNAFYSSAILAMYTETEYSDKPVSEKIYVYDADGKLGYTVDIDYTLSPPKAILNHYDSDGNITKTEERTDIDMLQAEKKAMLKHLA